MNKSAVVNYKTGNSNNTYNNTFHSNSNNSNKSENIKDIINKRKLLIQKQKERDLVEKKGKAKINLESFLVNQNNIENNYNSNNNNLELSEELLDIVKDFDITTDKMAYTSKNNVKITNITNYIVGTKSFDIKTKTNDIMLRDIKALNIITQKAMSTHSKHNPIDSIDDERKSFCKFQNTHSKKALFIDDNSDLPVGIGKEFPITMRADASNLSKENFSNSFTFANDKDKEKEKKHSVINIININNNYNIGNINMHTVENAYNVNNYYSMNTNASKTSQKSFKTMNMNNYKKASVNHNLNDTTPKQNETPFDSARSNLSNKTLRKLIPKNSHTTSKDLGSSIVSNNKSIKDIINSVKKEPKREKFIKLTK